MNVHNHEMGIVHGKSSIFNDYEYIEGGEKELFSKNTSWFDDFYLAIIELHDWLYPKQNASLPFIKMISLLNRDFVYIRENIFSIKN